MAEPIGVASGLLALTNSALTSSTTLYKILESHRIHAQSVRALSEELEALTAVLNSLTKTVGPMFDGEYSALELPLLRCSKTCQELQEEIVKFSSRSPNSTSFCDWEKLKYMGEDIYGLRRLLAGYKGAINLALTDEQLCKSTATSENIQAYQDLVTAAQADFKHHLERVNEKLDIGRARDGTIDALDIEALKEERLSTEKCLQICAQLSRCITESQRTHAYKQSPSHNVSPSASSIVLADWQPSEVQRVFGYSAFSWVGLMDDGCSVLKYPRRQGDDEAMQTLYEEAARYDHVGPHKNLVLFKGIHKHGLVFEYCEKGSLGDVIQYQQPPLTDSEKTVLGQQITRCLVHLHAHNLIHGDISVRNVFITAATVAKVGDLQGQLYYPDGATVKFASFTNENSQSRHPLAGEDEFSQRTDIFALGTLLYCLWYGQLPFPELNEFYQEEEIQAKYRRSEYPLSLQEARGMDKIICKCWHSEYNQMVEVLTDMEQLGKV